MLGSQSQIQGLFLSVGAGMISVWVFRVLQLMGLDSQGLRELGLRNGGPPKQTCPSKALQADLLSPCYLS